MPSGPSWCFNHHTKFAMQLKLLFGKDGRHAHSPTKHTKVFPGDAQEATVFMRVLGCYPRELAPSLVRTRSQPGLRSLLNSSSMLANALPAAVSRAAPLLPQAAEHAPLPSLNGCAPVQARPRCRA